MSLGKKAILSLFRKGWQAFAEDSDIRWWWLIILLSFNLRIKSFF